ncbi:hypothetical protein [Rugamonas rivuli]|uniref:OfxX fusion product n=1 Tax=Rugamonas rivuli TaxID=2743358 RepID=A0A843SN86_9BURK|nr:hypothetical protein [Rugamonas rivuli]MQA23653.1 hypothetical protein [Rugamonas rivuli]
MDIKINGLLTADRLREVLALVEAGPGITCYFHGRLQLRAAAASPAGAPRIDSLLIQDRAEEFQPEGDLEIEEDHWDGPLPTYIGGVVDNSPEELERRRLLEEGRQKRELRLTEASALKQRLDREHMMNKELFGRLRLRYGQPFIGAINAEIAAVWREVKPVFSHNCKDGKAGQLRPMPQLELRGDTVSFHGFNLAGTTTRIATPVSMPDNMEGARPHWKYKEWGEYAVPRIRAVINEYAEKAQLVKVGVKAESSS